MQELAGSRSEMLDWARSGLWRLGKDRKLIGRTSGEDAPLSPMSAQYFDLACCCCSPYELLVVSCPPASDAPSLSITALRLDPLTLDQVPDSAWELVTSLIDPDTNTTESGRWAVRRIDTFSDYNWRIRFGGYDPEVTKTEYCTMDHGSAFIDGGVWVTRARANWLTEKPAGADTAGQQSSSYVSISGEYGITQSDLIARRSSPTSSGQFWFWRI